MNQDTIYSDFKQIPSLLVKDINLACSKFVNICDYLNAYQNESIILYAKYNSAESDYIKNLISYQERVQIHLQVTDGILILLSKIRDFIIKENIDIEEIEPDLTKSKPILFNRIVGCESIIQEIIEKLDNSNVPLVINGIGGTGKTSIIAHLYSTYKTKYKHYCWIDYIQDLKYSFIYDENIVDFLRIERLRVGNKIEQKFEEILQKIKRLPGPKLLIIDGLDEKLTEEEYKIILTLQRNHFWKIIITSKRTHYFFDNIRIPELSTENALRIFNFYKIGLDNAETDNVEVIDLLNLIGKNPLLIELFAKLLKHSFSLNGSIIINALKKKELQKISIKISTAMEFTDKTITEFIKSSFNISTLTSNQKEILIQIAIFPDQEIPFEIAKFAFQVAEAEILEFESALNSLVEIGWLSKNTNCLFLHQTLRLAIKENLTPSLANCEKIIESFGYNLYKLIQSNPSEEYNLYSYLPYLQEIISYFSVKESKLAWIYHNLSLINKKYDKVKVAYDFGLDCIQCVLEDNLTNETEKAIFYTNIAEIGMYYGKIPEIAQYIFDAITIVENKYDDLIQKAETYDIFSTYNLVTGNFLAAIKNQKIAIELREKLYDFPHPVLARSYWLLSFVYLDLHDYNSALTYQLKVLDLRENLLPENLVELSKTYTILSLIYLGLNDIEKALFYQDKAIILKENTLGLESPHLATSYHNKGVILLKKESYSESLGFLSKAFRIRTNLSVLSPSLFRSYKELGRVYLATNDFENTNICLDKAMNIAEKVFDKFSYELADIYDLKSRFNFITNQIGAAKFYAEKTLEILEKWQPDFYQTEYDNALSFLAEINLKLV